MIIQSRKDLKAKNGYETGKNLIPPKKHINH